MRRRSKKPAKPARGMVSVEIIDRVNRANQIVRSARTGMVILGGDTGFGPMVRAALEVAIVELDEVKALLGECHVA